MSKQAGFRTLCAAALAASVALVAHAKPGGADPSVRCEAPAEQLVNGSVEAGTWAPGAAPPGWRFESWSGSALGTWESGQAHGGQRSLRIDNTRFDDARWVQSVATTPGAPMYLSGWLRTQGVQRDAAPYSGPGANLSLLDQWDSAGNLAGTHAWTAAGGLFRAPGSQVTAAARLGFNAGLARGTAWFDDLSLRALAPMNPIPRWRVLLLIYTRTEITMPNRQGFVDLAYGQSSLQEVNTTIEQARRFFNEDVPALSSGYQLPELTVRVASRPLTRVTPVAEGWRPSSTDVADQIDPSFDAVVVVWEPRVRWASTGAQDWIGYAAGLTEDSGLRQGYVSMSIQYAGQQGHRNVYKHEFGHTLLFYFKALGVTPSPQVENHTIAGTYVNCRTGQPYVWVDETDAQPVPNSIYSNSAGFTHDYYSGRVALSSAPSVCLGIGPQAWAWGGPASHSGVRPVFTGVQRVTALQGQVEGLRAAGLIGAGEAEDMAGLLSQARQALDRGNEGLAHAKLTVLGNRLRHLQRSPAWPDEIGQSLQAAVQAADSCIKPGR